MIVEIGIGEEENKVCSIKHGKMFKKWKEKSMTDES